MLQLLGRNIREQDGIWILDVNPDGEGKRTKTGKRRNVSLHPALVSEGFLEYARSVSPDARLFSGTDATRAYKSTGEWVRRVAGLTDSTKAPNRLCG
jgi:hypothetical protein